MDKRKFEALLDKYLAGQCSPAETELLHQFYDAFQKSQHWPGAALGPKGPMEAALWRGVQNRAKMAAPKAFETPKTGAWRLATVLVLALALLVGGAVWYWQNPAPVEMLAKTTFYGQKSTLVLADGTTVRLNSGSTLTYPRKFADGQRVVSLQGEAFFEVVKNPKKPFVVKTAHLHTTVLGTSFNVQAYTDAPTQVTVATGKVAVAPANGETGGNPVLLNPGDQAAYSPASQRIEKRTVDIGLYLGWKEGQIHFEDTPLSEATLVLSRWYGVEMALANPGLGNCKIASGTYKGETLWTILESFQYILGVRYEVSADNRVVLSGKGCP